jgi:hypothetical protein
MSSRKPEPKKRWTPIELFLRILNLTACIAYASTEHNMDILHPFSSAIGTAFRMTFYSIAGQFIGDFFPIIGDLCVIGSLGAVTGKILLTK